VLFSGVSRYGKAHLQAPRLIDGVYTLQIDANANCPTPEPLLLRVQQSGIYINAALVTQYHADEVNMAKLTLDGQWQEPELTLAGKVPGLEVCGKTVGRVAIATQSQPPSHSQPPSFNGTLTASAWQEPLTFRTIAPANAPKPAYSPETSNTPYSPPTHE
jgi:hypothetical protein